MSASDTSPIRDSLPGRVLQGSGSVTYHVRDLLGEGGQGWVFRAHWDGPDGALVIVKVLRPDVLTDDSLVRFQREAQVLRLLSQQTNPCPNVVRFFDHATTEVLSSDGKRKIGLPFTVLEYVRGTTLERVLGLQERRGLPVERIRRIFRHAVTALESVHAQGVIHRDFKPSNVLLSGDGVEELAKVTDFGLAKVISSDFGRTKKVAGASIGYAPPEQYERGNARISPRSDVFSLGAVVFEMLSGVPAYPFEAHENPLIVVTRILQDKRPSLREAKGKLSPELARNAPLVADIDRVLAKALDADPDRRWESPARLLAELDALLREGASPAQTVSERIGQKAIVVSAPPAVAKAPEQDPAGPLSRTVPASVESIVPSVAPSVNAPRKAMHGTVPLNKTPLQGGKGGSQPGIQHTNRFQWTLVPAPGLAEQSFFSGAIALDGSRAFALSSAGLFWISPGGSGALALPSGIPFAAWNGIAVTSGSMIVVFGKGGLVALVDPSGDRAPVLLGSHDSDVSFLGAATRGEHLYLVGASEQEGKAPLGVIAHYWEHSLVHTHRTTAPATLRACTSVNDAEVYACGDSGALTVLRGDTFTPLECPCAARLLAIESTKEGLFAVGEGGHILRMGPKGATLEPAGTQQDLYCITESPDGLVWVGAGEGRLLQYVHHQGFPRANRGVVHRSAVLRIWCKKDAVRALTSDGTILLGTRA